MSLQQRVCKMLGGLAFIIAFPSLIFAQTNSSTSYGPQAGEYTPIGSLLGDQAYASMSLKPTGGYIVWQDNITDGSGYGISAVQLDGTLSSAGFSTFQVNQQGTNDQENPQVAVLPNGGAAFVWQGGRLSFQHIYARFRSSSNLWVTGDIQVNTSTNYQITPAIAALTNGNVVVAWGAFGQDNADGFQGVYAQILSSTGQKVGTEFRVNQYTPFNQRSPAIAVLPNGNFIVVWVSEKERYSQSAGSGGTVNPSYGSIVHDSVDIYARVYSGTGAALGNEYLVSTGTNVCANPAIATGADGTYIITWSQRDAASAINGWDVFGRQFSTNGVGGAIQVVNSQRYGDQFRPKISSVGTEYLAVWTSMGQDGSREGVFGQFLKSDGSHDGAEFQVNTTVINQQIYPNVASDGTGRFLAVWSSFVGINAGLDLYAQRYSTVAQPLSAPNSPLVLALDSYTLGVSWPTVQGFNVSYYELFIDGSATPTIVSNNMWSSRSVGTYNPSSTHGFQLAYVLTDGRQSPPSTAAYGTTWGVDANFDGLPDDWEIKYYGTNTSNWPTSAGALLAPGVSVLNVFLWGADPTNPSTWLKQWINKTSQGLFLNWNTVPGAIYQVQTSQDLKTWISVGNPRFESGTTDSLYLGYSSQGYYRIIRNRY